MTGFWWGFLKCMKCEHSTAGQETGGERGERFRRWEREKERGEEKKNLNEITSRLAIRVCIKKKPLESTNT